MGSETGIAWTDHTFNPWWGCTKVSAGCTNCYADTFAKRTGHDIWGPGKPRRTFGAKHWAEPLKWNATAEKAGVRAKVFCASMADVFDAEAPAGELDRLWSLIRATPWLDWQLLTKRPERIAASLPADWGNGYPNVWLGTSVEDQRAAEARIPVLAAVPAHVRFLSCEPLLGPLDLSGDWCLHDGSDFEVRYEFQWIIVGGESGPHHRLMDKDWARSLRDWSAKAGVAFFYKQDGGLRPGHGDLDGELRQQFPFPDSVGHSMVVGNLDTDNLEREP